MISPKLTSSVTSPGLPSPVGVSCATTISSTPPTSVCASSMPLSTSVAPLHSRPLSPLSANRNASASAAPSPRASQSQNALSASSRGLASPPSTSSLILQLINSRGRSRSNSSNVEHRRVASLSTASSVGSYASPSHASMLLAHMDSSYLDAFRSVDEYFDDFVEQEMRSPSVIQPYGPEDQASTVNPSDTASPIPMGPELLDETRGSLPIFARRKKKSIVSLGREHTVRISSNVISAHASPLTVPAIPLTRSFSAGQRDSTGYLHVPPTNGTAKTDSRYTPPFSPASAGSVLIPAMFSSAIKISTRTHRSTLSLSIAHPTNSHHAHQHHHQRSQQIYSKQQSEQHDEPLKSLPPRLPGRRMSVDGVLGNSRKRAAAAAAAAAAWQRKESDDKSSTPLGPSSESVSPDATPLRRGKSESTAAQSVYTTRMRALSTASNDSGKNLSPTGTAGLATRTYLHDAYRQPGLETPHYFAVMDQPAESESFDSEQSPVADMSFAATAAAHSGFASPAAAPFTIVVSHAHADINFRAVASTNVHSAIPPPAVNDSNCAHVPVEAAAVTTGKLAALSASASGARGGHRRSFSSPHQLLAPRVKQKSDMFSRYSPRPYLSPSIQFDSVGSSGDVAQRRREYVRHMVTQDRRDARVKQRIQYASKEESKNDSKQENRSDALSINTASEPPSDFPHHASPTFSWSDESNTSAKSSIAIPPPLIDKDILQQPERQAHTMPRASFSDVAVEENAHSLGLPSPPRALQSDIEAHTKEMLYQLSRAAAAAASQSPPHARVPPYYSSSSRPPLYANQVSHATRTEGPLSADGVSCHQRLALLNRVSALHEPHTAQPYFSQTDAHIRKGYRMQSGESPFDPETPSLAIPPVKFSQNIDPQEFRSSYAFGLQLSP